MPRRKKLESEKIFEFVRDFCFVPEGKFIGKPFALMDWQKEEIRRIYDNPAGTRRAILSFGRKNGKTAMASLLLLVHLCGPRVRPNSQLYSAAQSREQAGILFALAAKIVRMSPDLGRFVMIRDTAKELLCPQQGTKYRALSAEASTAYGLSPSFIVHDELGRVRGERSELYEALETATGAQDSPLSIIISTQAPTDSDLLSKLIDDAVAGHDPRTVVSLYSAPLDDDPFEVETVRKANPALGKFLNEAEVMGMAADAKRIPSRENEYRNLILNQRVEVSSPFLSKSVWTSCGDAPKSIEDAEVYGGLDLSESKDLTALVLIGKVDGKWQVHPTFWLPKVGLMEKSRTDRIPYDLWEKAGKLTSVPGRSVDYEYVAEWLTSVITRYDVKKIAFDRWNFKHLRPWLIKAGLDDKTVDEKFAEFGQGFQSMSPALRDLESAVLNQKIAHGNHPVLTMCALNAVVHRDPANNRKLVKHKSPGRIDGMIALTMAIGVVPIEATPKAREYQMMFM
jgi:phage terminase large subunit-like protein